MLFPEFGEEECLRFISYSQVEKLLKYEAQVFTKFPSLKVKIKAMMVDFPVVC